MEDVQCCGNIIVSMLYTGWRPSEQPFGAVLREVLRAQKRDSGAGDCEPTSSSNSRTWR